MKKLSILLAVILGASALALTTSSGAFAQMRVKTISGNAAKTKPQINKYGSLKNQSPQKNQGQKTNDWSF